MQVTCNDQSVISEESKNGRTGEGESGKNAGLAYQSPSLVRSRANPREVFRRHNDPPAEARVRADVFQMRCLIRRLVQQSLDPPTLGWLPVVVFLRPLGLYFYNERFAIRVKLVGHGDGEWVEGEWDE